MTRRLLICAAATVVFSVAAACTAFSGPPYAGYGEVHDSMTVSGVWSSVNWYESDGCYSGVGDPLVSDFESRAQGAEPIDLSTVAGDTYGNASSVLKVWAPSSVPTMTNHSWSSVQGVPENVGHWASAYGMGGANWLTSGATQEVTVRVDYSYSLDLTQANHDAPYAFVKMYAAFWGPSSNLLLTPDAEWVAEGNYLVKTVRIEDAGSSTGAVSGFKTWQVNVTNGAFYSFWGMAWSEVWTAGTPVSVDSSTWGTIKSLFR